ncbi:ABC transporter ATP-binding protein [Pelagibius sp.]|uniref:ABC transporter ATP-binding protein n=1 Tax=Pelagibius sp. TaxID=1931238 RepID=UPI003B504458
MARIELNSITKAWGDVVAVEPTDLTIDDGEFVAILGPSGCGKSTTLFMLAGIYAPSGGEMTFDGHLVNEVEAKDRNVGIVFQSYALYPHMTVRDNIGFPLKFKDIPKDRAAALVGETARLVQVEELLDRRPSQLSGGQQQRVALARALVKTPQLLLLDEPLSNLDATLRLSMRTEIRALQQRTAITTILVTHDQIEATTMADRIICMSKGRVEQIGTPEDLYRRPDSLFVASFIGAPPINLLPGRASGGSLAVGEAQMVLAGQAEGDVVLGLRPEHLVFAENGLPGRIEGIEPMGREVLYRVDTPLGELRMLEGNAVPSHDVGTAVHLRFSADDSLLFDAVSERRIAEVRADSPASHNIMDQRQHA